MPESTASIVKLPPAKSGLKLTGLSSPLPKGGGYKKIGKPYEVKGVLYVPRADPEYEEIGIASWYGDDFHGKMTANGEVYDMNALTAAHRTLPLPSLATVTNVATGRSVIVRINDRGPFKKGRIIDVSARVARELGFSNHGIAKVRVKYLGPAPLNGNDTREKAHLATLAH
jgi:peptidoglycan lytic transglycosylase